MRCKKDNRLLIYATKTALDISRAMNQLVSTMPVRYKSRIGTSTGGYVRLAKFTSERDLYEV